ncbi:MAG: tRNA1(Val) (adenine(37)-N6)-methyltransferase [Lachnospiraceae bacterium]|nr:tRNA1(Val) (adenine(37)-N6)-methyltransferase [Lachnospiraceae bacterium]
MLDDRAFVREGERIDDLQRNGLRILQNPQKFCFGMDAVLLSGFVKAKEGERVLDLGTGTGILPLLLSAKTEAAHFDALEIQDESADMARRSVEMNGLSERISVRVGDLKEASDIYGKAVFDVVTCNPPYMNDGAGLKNPEEPMAIARHEVLCSLDDVIRESAAVLKERGRLYLVHRPQRLSEIFAEMRAYRLEPKRMKLVHPFADKDANMVLIEAVKGAGVFLKVEAPVVVYREPGVYTDEIYDVYGY